MAGSDFLPYGRHVIDQADIDRVIEVLRGDWLTTGPTVEAFEQAFATKVGAREAIACSSGTAGLHLAAMALDLAPGDALVVPSVTFLATANAARYVGAEVVFADVDPDTGLTNAEHVAQAIEQAGELKVRALSPVHLSGHCVDVAALARSWPDLPIIEDACHALGADNADANGERQLVGSCADSTMAMFSTHPVKTIATAEGGMLTTNDAELAARLRRLRNHGMVRENNAFQRPELAFEADGTPAPWYYEMQEVGYNYRLNDLQCALGLSQLDKLDGFVARRRELRQHYATRIAELGDPRLVMTPVAENCDPAWHLAVALLDFPALDTTRSTLMNALRERGIGTQVHYIPVHHQPYYRERYGAIELPGADAYYARCLSLPLFPRMETSDVDRVVDILADLLNL